MFKFTEESRIVDAWVTLILAGEKTIDDVPMLWNLKEVVTEVLKKKKGDK